jgi:hypothetical protein
MRAWSPGRRGADQLRTGFRLAALAIEQDRRGERALRVLAGDREQRRREPAAPARQIPKTEQVHEEEDVRRMQDDGRRRPFALDVRQLLDEVARVGRVPLVKPEGRVLLRRPLAVGQVALRREADPLPEPPAPLVGDASRAYASAVRT